MRAGAPPTIKPPHAARFRPLRIIDGMGTSTVSYSARRRDRAPVLGAWPDRPGHFIANGGFKIGFGMAPKVAETIALLMLEGRDTIPPGFRVEDNL